MYYALDGAEQRGIVYEAAQRFELFMNKKLDRKKLRVLVMIIPVRRDELLTALLDGRGDVAAGNLTITPERLALVDFSDPLMRDVSEVVVTGPKAPPLEAVADLGGVEVHLREGSSYWSTMRRLNAGLRSVDKPEARLVATGAFLEDHDLLEMVNAGLVPATVVDAHKARFWSQVFDDIEVREDLSVNRGGQIGWAIRPGSPDLRKLLDEFVKKHRKGTTFGNVVYRRYLEDASWVNNALDASGRDRFEGLAEDFKKYAGQYDLDWRLVAAQAYQESGLDPGTRSHAGAVGVMQLLPKTAKSIGFDDIRDPTTNIHAGVKYMRHIIDTYFDEPELEPSQRHLFALAAYNAGPTRISKLRREAASKGLDPNVWFDNVEVVVARRVGSETVRYVGNIVKYYVAYKLIPEA
jgi:membrane-bound lytic murein transglycosylase MltF